MAYGHFHVTMELPEGAEVTDMREYVQGEVRAGVGAKHPDDPIRHMKRDSVRVVSLGVSRTRSYDEGSYDQLSDAARKDDHRRLDQENQNFRTIINWLAREGELPPVALAFLKDHVTKAITEGGVMDLELEQEVAESTKPLFVEKTGTKPRKLRG